MKTNSSYKRAALWSVVTIALGVLVGSSNSAVAQLDFERAPFEYSNSDPTDAIATLNSKLKSKDVRLQKDEANGYLKSLLQALEVPESSQTLVFSKTSFQRHRISPKTPRAVYFNDDVYVGWVQNGDAIEISTADPNLGAVFYTLDQEEEGPAPSIVRQTDHCMICHASTHTRRVPGHIMRSVFPDRKGMPVFSAGTFRTNDRSPLKERWGGWYVSGSHGNQRHMGNAILTSKRKPESLDVESGANLSDLSQRFKTEPYLTPHSDIAALMVLAHQVGVHNEITAANYSFRRTIYDAKVMNEALERDVDFESDSTKRRFTSAAEDLVEALLMTKQTTFTEPIVGSSNFCAEFEARGPFDDAKRSLRQFDLKTRLFRYPCSFLIYSEAFDALPDRGRKEVYRILFEVLAGKFESDKFDHLTTEDRTAIREILLATKSIPGS
ncbi:MAG: hypothetical protein AB8G99_21155 [Planctomycetaceae bacterium]